MVKNGEEFRGEFGSISDPRLAIRLRRSHANMELYNTEFFSKEAIVVHDKSSAPFREKHCHAEYTEIYNNQSENVKQIKQTNITYFISR